VCIEDRWTAYQFDAAVTMLGVTIENALQEQQNVGSDKQPKYEAKYTLAQLLADDFRLPGPVKATTAQGIAGLIGLPGVKVIRAKG